VDLELLRRVLEVKLGLRSFEKHRELEEPGGEEFRIGREAGGTSPLVCKVGNMKWRGWAKVLMLRT
jgi:hypothetical protein